MTEGFLLIDKPTGWTSFDVVAKVRGIIKRETGHKIKVGHAGTLDPAATGLLVLALGKATKQIDTLMKHQKSYQTTLQLGQTSTTDDREGELSDVSVATWPDEERVQSVLKSFVGEISQIPPAFSAIKVDGKRAYKMAREGKKVELKPRTVTIESIEDIVFNEGAKTIDFTVVVSSGTYIRSLARDIGAALGTGAYMSQLRRLTVGEFSVQDALVVEELSFETIQSRLLPVLDVS